MSKDKSKALDYVSKILDTWLPSKIGYDRIPGLSEDVDWTSLTSVYRFFRGYLMPSAQPDYFQRKTSDGLYDVVDRRSKRIIATQLDRSLFALDKASEKKELEEIFQEAEALSSKDGRHKDTAQSWLE